MIILIPQEEANRLNLQPIGAVTGTDDRNYVSEYRKKQVDGALTDLQAKAQEKGATHVVVFGSPSYAPGPGMQVGATSVMGMAYKAA